VRGRMGRSERGLGLRLDATEGVPRSVSDLEIRATTARGARRVALEFPESVVGSRVTDGAEGRARDQAILRVSGERQRTRLREEAVLIIAPRGRVGPVHLRPAHAEEGVVGG